MDSILTSFEISHYKQIPLRTLFLCKISDFQLRSEFRHICNLINNVLLLTCKTIFLCDIQHGGKDDKQLPRNKAFTSSVHFNNVFYDIHKQQTQFLVQHTQYGTLLKHVLLLLLLLFVLFSSFICKMRSFISFSYI